MSSLRRLLACALALGALLLSFAAVPAWGAAPSASTATSAFATPASTTVGPVQMTVPGFGSGADNIAYQEAFISAYHMAATYGYPQSQCPVTFGPVQLTLWPSGYAEWALELTCYGDPPQWPQSTYDLTRYWDQANNDHRSTMWIAPAGATVEGVLGRLYSAGSTPGTHPLYMCKVGKDTFTSPDVNCEGTSYMTRLGWIYSAKPSGVSTRPLFRCRTATGEHFDSMQSDCEGQTVDGPLGYALT